MVHCKQARRRTPETTPPPEEAMVHFKQARGTTAGIPWTRSRARAAAAAVADPGIPCTRSRARAAAAAVADPGIPWTRSRARAAAAAVADPGIPCTRSRARAAAAAVADPGIPWTRSRARAAATAVADPGIPWTRSRARAAAAAVADPGYMTPMSSSQSQTPPPRRQPGEPAQGAGEAGSSSLVPSAHHLGSFGARHLFHGNADNEEGAIAGGKDRLSALPDDVIQLVLSFLSSRQVVQTCVLATRWRTLWKSVPSLRFDHGDEPYMSSYDIKRFIDGFVRCRAPTPLHECEIILHNHMETEEFRHDYDRWLRYAVSCKVRVLRFEILHGERLQLSAGTLISQHLTRLILRGVEFEDFYLDVLSCQSLEVLEMLECGIDIRTAFPKSLKHLRISHTRFSPDDPRSIISAPGLVTLELDSCWGWTPLLNRLPALVTAFINIGSTSMDSCMGDLSPHESCVMCSDLGDDDCVLLQGLSGAANLELITVHSKIFNKDIRRCPVFSNLKTLLLGYWFVRANFSGLVYFLRHSPILERLTLDPCSEDFLFHESEPYKPKEQFLVSSKHLKEVTVRYYKGDGRIYRILKLLDYHGVPSELIHFEEHALGFSYGFPHIELTDEEKEMYIEFSDEEEEEEEVGMHLARILCCLTSTGEDMV